MSTKLSSISDIEYIINMSTGFSKDYIEKTKDKLYLLLSKIEKLEKENGWLGAILGKTLSQGIISIDGVNLVEENERLRNKLQEIKSGEYCRYLDDGICPEITRAERRGYELATKQGAFIDYDIDMCKTSLSFFTYEQAKAAEAADASM